MNQTIKAFKKLSESLGARFASLIYTSKGSGQVARVTVLLGADYETAKAKDLVRLKAKFASLQGVSRVACRELIRSYSKGVTTRRIIAKLKSILDSQSETKRKASVLLIAKLEKKLHDESDYTCKDAYDHTPMKGLLLHKETGIYHLQGFLVGKPVIIKEGTFKTVNSSKKTLAKNDLKASGRLGKFRQYVLTSEQVESLKTNGRTLTF